MKNPYVFGTPVRSPKYFVGREIEIRRIAERIRSGASTSLIGERRSGKTSLLLHLTDPIVAESLGLSKEKYLLIYVDLQGLSDLTPERFWQRIFDRAIRLSGDSILVNFINTRTKIEERNFSIPNDIFSEAKKRDVTIVLLLDEFEHILQNSKFDHQFFNSLRSLANHYEVVMVTSTRRELSELMRAEATSPFFNIFATVILRPFSRTESFKLIETYLENTDLHYSEKEMELIYQQGGGFPFFVQMAGYYVAEGKQSGLRDENLKEFVIKEFQSQADPQFNYFWSSSSDEEKIILLVLLVFVLQRKIQPTSENIIDIHADARYYLSKLNTRGLVIEEGGRFRIFSGGFEDWISKEYPATAVQSNIDLNSERILEILNYKSALSPYVSQFFEKAGFNIKSNSDNSLVLTSQTELPRLGTHPSVHVVDDHILKANDIQNLVNALRKNKIELNQHVAFLVVENQPDAGARAQIFAYRWENGLVIVPISSDRVRQAVLTDVCAQELGSILNDYLSYRPDLYDRSIPVSQDDFFGRLQVIDELLAYLNEHQPIAVFALNKMGKTSLIRNLAERLTDRIVASIDLQVLPLNLLAIYTEIIRALEHDIYIKWGLKEELTLSWLEGNVDKDNPKGAFIKGIGFLYKSLLKYTNSPRFVIFIDEIDRLIPSEPYIVSSGFSNCNDLITTLRGLSQQGIPLTFIVVGIQAHINRKALLAGIENAGFQMFRELHLAPMTRDECDQMVGDIGQQMGIEYTIEALSCIYYESGGHPFVARQLCSQAWKTLPQMRISKGIVKIDATDAIKATRAYINDGRKASYFEQIWEARLDDNERNVVKQLAATEILQPVNVKERQTVNGLLERHIIIREGHKIRLAFGLFSKWVRAFILGIEEA